MKKFTFSLDRVLAWRRTEREVERAALAKLLTERDALSGRADTIRGDRARFERSLANALHFDGGSVPTLHHWQTSVNRSIAELSSQLGQIDARATTQIDRLREAEFRVRLLEQLRDRRLSEWKIAMSVEEETQASEAYLARFARLKRNDSVGA